MDISQRKPKVFIHVNSLEGGGAERVASLWASGLCGRGYDVTLVIRNDGRPIVYVPSDGVTIVRIGPRHGSKRKKLRARLAEARALIRKHRPDVIIGVMTNASLEVKLASFGLGVPVICTEHNAFEQPDSAPMTLSRRIQKRCVLRLFDHVTVLTRRDYEIASRYLRHVSQLPNPLAFNAADEAAASDKEKLVLASGRLDDWHYKGFDLLIKAWGMVDRRDWRLRVLGTGSLRNRQRLLDLAQECGVSDSVELVGFRDNPLDDYRKASVFVLSSRYEGFGMVLIEAMSQGCACIASDYLGRQREIMGEDSESSGLVVDVESAKAIADGLGRVLDDDDLRLKLQRGAVRRSEFFSLDRITDRLENIFRTL